MLRITLLILRENNIKFEVIYYEFLEMHRFHFLYFFNTFDG